MGCTPSQTCSSSPVTHEDNLHHEDEYMSPAPEQVDTHLAISTLMEALQQDLLEGTHVKSCLYSISVAQEADAQRCETSVQLKAAQDEVQELQEALALCRTGAAASMEHSKQLDTHNAQLADENEHLRTALAESQAVQEGMITESSTKQEQLRQQILQYQVTLQRRENQLVEVNQTVLNYWDSTDTLDADCSISTVDSAHDALVREPVKKLLAVIKFAAPLLLQPFQQHAYVTANSQSRIVQSSSISKLFLHTCNERLQDLIWQAGSTVADAHLPPLLHRQQIQCHIDSLGDMSSDNTDKSMIKLMVNRFLGMHREFCKFWMKSSQWSNTRALELDQAADQLVTEFCLTLLGVSDTELPMEAQRELQSILAGALRVRVATEVLHPLFRLYVPKLSEGICSRPGIIVISKPNDPPVLLADVDTCGMQCSTLDH